MTTVFKPVIETTAKRSHFPCNPARFASDPFRVENSMVDLSILIVCYKSRDLISECLQGIEKYTSGCQYEVLLLDCSNDGTVDLVKSKFPATRIVENSENLGFARGNNVLAEHATGTYLLLLNPDVVITDDAIGELYRTAVSMPAAGAIGGRTRLPDGSRDPGCRQCRPTLFRLASSVIGCSQLFHGMLAENAKVPANVETLHGAFMIVRRDAWLEIGGFDTSFFMYSEELDLCQRLQNRAWSIVMTPRAEIIHLAGGGDGQNPRRVCSIMKSKMHFIRKYWSHFHVVLAGALLWSHALVRVVVSYIALPIIGVRRSQKLRQAFAPIVLRPGGWWHGFEKDCIAGQSH